MNLATIERITSIRPHPNADRLDIAQVLGYECVIQKDSGIQGGLCIFIKPDTTLPDAPWAETFNKFSKTRVKAMCLRGEWSMGIALPMGSSIRYGLQKYQYSSNDDGVVVSILETDDGWDIYSINTSDDNNQKSYHSKLRDEPIEGWDLTEFMGIYKYEPPIPENLDAKSPHLPYTLSKTDEESYQTFLLEHPEYLGEEVLITQKIDGCSATYYCFLEMNGEITCGITTRTQDLKLDSNNRYTEIDKKYDILNKLQKFCLEHHISLAIRGEIYGDGLQGGAHNPHSGLPLGFMAFSVYNLSAKKYERIDSELHVQNLAVILGIPAVPVLGKDIFTQKLIDRYDRATTLPNGSSFEGIVLEGATFSCKIINKVYDSNKY